ERQEDFDKATSRRRNIIERALGWFKWCRALAFRFDKLAVNYVALWIIANIQYLLRKYPEPLGIQLSETTPTARSRPRCLPQTVGRGGGGPEAGHPAALNRRARIRGQGRRWFFARLLARSDAQWTLLRRSLQRFGNACLLPAKCQQRRRLR